MGMGASIIRGTIGKVLDQLPLKGFYWKLFFLGGASMLGATMNSLIVSYLLSLIGSNFFLTNDQLAVLIGAGSLGLLVGSIVFGHMGEILGRKTSLWSTIMTYSVFSVLCGLSPNYQLLLVFRFATSMGVGGNYIATYSYLAEYLPDKSRGRLLALLDVFYGVGSVVSGLISLLLLPFQDNWRIAFLLGGIPIFLAIIVMIGLFESPRYLVSRNRYEEAKIVVEKVANKVGTKVEVKQESRDFSEKAERRSLAENLKSEFSGLWSHKFRKITAIFWFTWFSIVFTEFAITFWLPTILIRTGVSTGLAFICNMIIESVNIPGPFLVAYLIEKLGRKNLAAFALMGYGLSLILWNGIIGGSLSLVVGVGLIMREFMEMSFATMYVYTAEAYSTKVRSSGLGWAVAVGRIGGLIGSVTLPTLWGMLGLSRAFLIPAATCILASPLIFFMGTETKGKPLQDDA